MDKITSLWQARVIKNDSNFYAWTRRFAEVMTEVAYEQTQLMQGLLSICEGVNAHLAQTTPESWWCRGTVPSITRGTPDENPEVLPQQLVINITSGISGLNLENAEAVRVGSFIVAVNTQPPKFATVADVHPNDFFEEWMGTRADGAKLPANQAVIFSEILKAAYTKGFRFDNLVEDDDRLTLFLRTKHELMTMRFDFNHMRLTAIELDRLLKLQEEYVQSNPPTGG